ncbi:hypothetical protein FHG87_001853 [Trinorchestia longiramus]|nr:hypothetical protein FHG87_001853 [Trinorchestia longiramus]
MAFGTGVPRICWSILWFLFLIFAGLWIAGFCAWWYIMFSVVTACCPRCQTATDVLLKGVQFAGQVSYWMVNGTQWEEAKLYFS